MKPLLIYILAVLLVACNKNAAIPENTLQEDHAIDSKIKVTVKEYLNTKKLLLYCATEKAYPCINYKIRSEQHFNESNKLTINFIDVPQIGACLTAIGPATTEIDLSLLANGEYVLELNNDGIKNQGLIKISDSEIVLDFKDQKSIVITTPVIKRVPGQTYWGTMATQEQIRKAR